MRQRLLHDRDEIDRLEQPVVLRGNQFIVKQSARIEHAPFEESPRADPLHLDGKGPPLLILADKVQDSFLSEYGIDMLLPVKVGHNVRDLGLGGKQGIDEEDEQVLVLPVGKHCLESGVGHEVDISLGF